MKALELWYAYIKSHDHRALWDFCCIPDAVFESPVVHARSADASRSSIWWARTRQGGGLHAMSANGAAPMARCWSSVRSKSGSAASENHHLQ